MVRPEEVKEKSDLLDMLVRILLLVQIGAIVFLHLGTPCNSFSIAGSSSREVSRLGFKNLAQELFATMFIGFRSLILPQLVLLAGGNFSLENLSPPSCGRCLNLKALVEKFRLFFVDTDQCEFGALSMKPTRFLVSRTLCKEWAP